MRFRQIRRVKQCVFGDNAVFAKIRLCGKILHLIKKIFETLDLNLVFYGMMQNKCEKRIIDSRACVP
jgi:hypothetical protein